jgi:hypothetical protein
VTGVFVDGEDVYVEREHSALVRVGDTSGRADPDQPEVPGRPSRDGSLFLSAALIDAASGRAMVNAVERPSLQHRFTRELRTGSSILSLVLLDSDLRGTIYLGALLHGPGETAGPLRVVCLSSQTGAPWGSADLAANSGPEETFRELVVLDEGGFLYAVRDAQGARYTRSECR